MATPRERAREQTLADITRLGREQLASVGAAELSVRSLARDLGVVSSAVYRYVKSRDDLLTLLVVDAYGELGELADAAAARRRTRDHAGRVRAIAHAVRDWALAEPARYALIFGSPVAGYVAPAEQTTEVGTRIPMLLLETLAAAWREGTLAGRQGVHLPRDLTRDLDRVAEQAANPMPAELTARGMLLWTSLFGAVSFEVFGQYGADTLTTPRQLFEHDLDRMLEQVGLVQKENP